MTAREIERVHHISIATLARWRRDGTGPKWKAIGGRVRYDPTSVAAYFIAPLSSGTTVRQDLAKIRELLDQIERKVASL